VLARRGFLSVSTSVYRGLSDQATELAEKGEQLLEDDETRVR
jgi:hypothetical protein